MSRTKINYVSSRHISATRGTARNDRESHRSARETDHRSAAVDTARRHCPRVNRPTTQRPRRLASDNRRREWNQEPAARRFQRTAPPLRGLHRGSRYARGDGEHGQHQNRVKLIAGKRRRSWWCDWSGIGHLLRRCNAIPIARQPLVTKWWVVVVVG